MRIAGQRIVITGASSGLGAALARTLAGRGGILVLASRRHERLDLLAGEIATANPRVPRPLPVACDVSSPESIGHLIASAVGQLGGIDILINDAGVSVYGSAERTAREDLQALLDVNLLGPFTAMQDVLPVMKRQGGGMIVNIASLAALHGVPYLAAYGASKAALAAMSQSLRAELAGTGIHMLVVYPGYMQTPLFDHEKKVGGARRPEPPYAPPERVAEAVARAIERNRSELVLTAPGRTMALLRGSMEPLLDRLMARLAARLRQKEVSAGG